MDTFRANVAAEIFQSTLSSRRATDYGLEDGREFSISIHALLTESDIWEPACGDGHIVFQSTLSSRRATWRRWRWRRSCPHFNPRSPHGERRTIPGCRRYRDQISIHALLTESDCMPDIADCTRPISIHALLTESDWLPCVIILSKVFISIHALLTESDPVPVPFWPL